jgi:signal transduction histidine kinase
MNALRILIAEDVEAERLMLTRFLSKRDYAVLNAANGNAALRLMETEQVDVVLSDIRMPILDGLGLLKAVKAHHPGVDVVLMTAYQDMETAIEATRGRAYDYIKKPFNLAEVHRILKHIHAERELRREVEEKREQIRKMQWISALGALSAGIMHEINNPNAVIAGNAHYLKTRLLPLFAARAGASSGGGASNDAEDATAALADIGMTCDAIMRGSARITAIVRRASSADLAAAVDRSVFDARDAVTSAARSLALRAEDAPRLAVNIPDTPIAVYGSEELLVKALENLLTNAVEAVAGTSSAEVAISVRMVRQAHHERNPPLVPSEFPPLVPSLSSDGDSVTITVEDNGPGVPAGMNRSIFTPFTTTKMDRPGRGLGLFIVEQIVMGLNGKLEFERAGGISRFSIVLPRGREAAR